MLERGDTEDDLKGSSASAILHTTFQIMQADNDCFAF